MVLPLSTKSQLISCRYALALIIGEHEGRDEIIKPLFKGTFHALRSLSMTRLGTFPLY